MHKKICRNSFIQIIRDDIKSFKKDSHGKRYHIFTNRKIEINSSHLVWTGRLSSLLKTKNTNNMSTRIKKSDHYILFLTIKRSYLIEDFSVLFIVDPNSFIYRIQNQTNCSNGNFENVNLTIEISSEYLSLNKGKINQESFKKKSSVN